jgi:hypothetical protein
MASQSDGVVKFLSPESLLTKSGIRFNAYDSTEWDNSLSVLHTFEQYKMIKVSTNGDIHVLNWEKKQEHNMTVAERVAKHRAKKAECNENVTTDVTSVTTEENRIEKNTSETDVSRIIPIEEEKVEKTPKEGTKPYFELCTWMSNLTGAPIPNRAKQFKHLSSAKKAGIKPHQLKERAEELWSKDFYRDQGMDWGTVVSSFDRKG